jgi:hypothetical protein
MNEKTGRIVELGASAAIALALLAGGRQLLLQLADFPLAACLLLVGIAASQVAGLRRRMRADTPDARLLVTRDLTFLGAGLLAIVVVLFRARWALGSSLVCAEFALVLDIVGRLSTPFTQPAPKS